MRKRNWEEYMPVNTEIDNFMIYGFKKKVRIFNIGNTVRGFEQNEEDGLWGHIFEGTIIKAGRYESLVKVHLHYNPELENTIIKADNSSLSMNMKTPLFSYFHWWEFIKDFYKLEERANTDEALLTLMKKYEKKAKRLIPFPSLYAIENQFIEDYHEYNKENCHLYSGKIKCVNVDKKAPFTVGNTYQVINGSIIGDKGFSISNRSGSDFMQAYYGCETFESFCDFMRDATNLHNLTFEEVIE